MARIKLQLHELGVVLHKTGQLMERNGVKALHNAAETGKKRTLTTIRKTRDPHRIKASGDYQKPQNWIVQKHKRGAILSATTPQAFFVERGRRPGRMPPYMEILDWGFKKRIGFRRGRGSIGRIYGGPRTRKAVNNIQRKIARFGIKGRWPLKRTMPQIVKAVDIEMKRACRATMGRKPITRKRRPRG